jgi:hypothetical protein
MGVNVSWDDPDQTILLFKFTAPWTMHDYAAAGDQEWIMLDSVGHRVDIILDLRCLDSLPSDMARCIWNAAAHVHLNRALLILVGEPHITQPFASVLRDVYPRSDGDIIQVESTYDARAIISTQFGFGYAPYTKRVQSRAS